MSNIRLSGSDILDKYIETIEEAETMLKQADYMDNLVFWVRGKAYLAIKEIISEGHSPYQSFKHYCEVAPVGVTRQYAVRLITAYQQVEVMREQGTPDNELPKTEGACRALRPKDPPKPPKQKNILDDTIWIAGDLIDRLDLIQKFINSGEKPDPVKSQTLTAALETIYKQLTIMLDYEK